MHVTEDQSIIFDEEDMHSGFRLTNEPQDELQKAGYIVDCCHDGETAIIHALSYYGDVKTK